MEPAQLPANTIQGVVLDVDGTLYHHFPVRVAMAAHLLLHGLSHPFSIPKKLRVIRSYRRQQEFLRTCDKLPAADDPQLYLTAKETNYDPGHLAGIVERWMRQAPLPYVALARRRWLIRLLRKWRDIGVPMAVYSDYPAREKLRRCGLGFLENHSFCSTDASIRAYKPNPRGFLATAELLGVPASGLVYLGDRFSVDALGALAAGMGYILLPSMGWRSPRPYGKIKKNLLELDRHFTIRYSGTSKKIYKDKQAG